MCCQECLLLDWLPVGNFRDPLRWRVSVSSVQLLIVRGINTFTPQVDDAYKHSTLPTGLKVASGGDGGGYWLLGLDRQLAGAGAALAGCLVISQPWGGKAEDDNAPW